jgi:hypothetical protein
VLMPEMRRAADRAAAHRPHRRDAGPDRAPGRGRPRLCGRGHVLFHVPSMADYGSLSKRPLDEMEAGARVDVAPTSARRSISCCGSRPARATRPGPRPPASRLGPSRLAHRMLGDVLEASRRNV